MLYYYKFSCMAILTSTASDLLARISWTDGRLEDGNKKNMKFRWLINLLDDLHFDQS